MSSVRILSSWAIWPALRKICVPQATQLLRRQLCTGLRSASIPHHHYLPVPPVVKLVHAACTKRCRLRKLHVHRGQAYERDMSGAVQDSHALLLSSISLNMIQSRGPGMQDPLHSAQDN